MTAGDCRGIEDPVEEHLIDVIQNRRELKIELSEEKEYIALKKHSTAEVDITQIKVTLTRLDLHCGNADHMVSTFNFFLFYPTDAAEL